MKLQGVIGRKSLYILIIFPQVFILFVYQPLMFAFRKKMAMYGALIALLILF